MNFCSDNVTGAAPEILAEASRLALLHNWQAAAPLFREAEISFAAQSDQRNFLYAHIGRLRGEIESQSLPEVSEYLADILTSPVTQSDLRLRLFCLVAKGDIDFQIDPKSSAAVWTEVAAVAARLRDDQKSIGANPDDFNEIGLARRHASVVI